MTYLIYCIFNTPGYQGTTTLSGVDDQPVIQVSSNGLVAAVSRITRENLKSDIPLIMAYKKVIDSFHRERTVIPMRYGCMMEEKKQVAQLLEKNRIQYEALLKKLDGCVEMGIRVLMVDCRLKIEDLRNSELENSDPKSPIQNLKSKMLGRAYIAARKAYYEQEDKLGKETDAIIEQYRTAFSGLYVNFKAEYASTDNHQADFAGLLRRSGYEGRKVAQAATAESSIPNHLLSLYLLVPRQSVKRFRRVFRCIFSGQVDNALLSGPWPPYNFVTDCSGLVPLTVENHSCPNPITNRQSKLELS